jgi:hypothetical protein
VPAANIEQERGEAWAAAGDGWVSRAEGSGPTRRCRIFTFGSELSNLKRVTGKRCDGLRKMCDRLRVHT